jgi:hypothetical protein
VKYSSPVFPSRVFVRRMNIGQHCRAHSSECNPESTEPLRLWHHKSSPQKNWRKTASSNGLISQNPSESAKSCQRWAKFDGNGGSGQTIKAEFSDLLHVRGAVGMARDEDPDSADSQFYICLADRPISTANTPCSDRLSRVWNCSIQWRREKDLWALSRIGRNNRASCRSE